MATITASNAQDPAQYGKVRVHGDNGASAGVQTGWRCHVYFGMSSITEAPYNDLWGVKEEENLLDQWKKEDEEIFFRTIRPNIIISCSCRDLSMQWQTTGKPLVTGEDGLKSAELIEAIYRSSRSGMPVKLSLEEVEA